MSLGLLLPAGLFALAALLLPLLIHLHRQAEQRPTLFAALRWLSAQPRPRQRLRFEDLLLLLVRLLLIAALALLLARPVLYGSEGDQRWIVVAPGVDVAAAKAQFDPSQARWHWLAPGFPGVDEARPASSAGTASLLRELDARLPARTPVTVFVPELLDGLDGERSRLARELDWRVLPGAGPSDTPAKNTPAPVLVLRHAPGREAGLAYLRAAAVAWAAMDETATDSPRVEPSNAKEAMGDAHSLAGRSDVGPVTQALPADARWLVWLSSGEVPGDIRRWVERGGVLLLDAEAVWGRFDAGSVDGSPDGNTAKAPGKSVAAEAAPTRAKDAWPVLWREGDGGARVRGAAFGRGRVLQLAQPLQPSAWPGLLEGDFPRQLRRMFEGEAPAPTRASAVQAKPLPGGTGFPETPRELESTMLWLLAALFAFERLLAAHRRPRVAA